MEWFLALFLGGIAAAIIYEQVQKPKRRREAQARDAQRIADAARKGWKLNVTREARHVIYAYAGTTEGIEWTLELSSWTSSSRGAGGSQTKVFTRWSSESASLPQGVLAIWPSFGEADKIGPQVPQFIMSLILGPLLKALGAESSDATLLTEAKQVPTDDPVLSRHYLLRASDPEAMRRLLASGAHEVLAEAAPWLPQRSSLNHLTLVAIWYHGVQMLVSGWVDDFTTIEKIVHTGVGLAKAGRLEN